MVAFTQFLLPRGERLPTSIDMSADVEAMADRLIAAGYRFECEVLRTGHVHVDCCGPALDGSGEDLPLASEICSNGPEVPQAVEQMIREAHAAWHLWQATRAS
jgi:hypothetical protein